MKARFGFVLFCIVVAWGYWAQRRYMALSRQEFFTETKADRTLAQLLAAKNFLSFQYENGVLISSVRSDTSTMLNNGETTFEGNVKYVEMDGRQSARMIVTTPRAICYLENSGSGQNFFDSNRKLEKIVLPGKVEARTSDDYLQTSLVTVDFKADLLSTDAAVSILGPSRVLDAEGFSYSMKSQTFKLLRNIRGHYVPTQGRKK